MCYRIFKLNFNTQINKLIFNVYLCPLLYYITNYSCSYNKYRNYLSKFEYYKYHCLHLIGDYFNLKELHINNIQKLYLNNANFNNFKLFNNYFINNELIIDKNMLIKKINLKNNEIYYKSINIKEDKEILIDDNKTILNNTNNNLIFNVIKPSNVELVGNINNCIFNGLINNLYMRCNLNNSLIGKFNNLYINNSYKYRYFLQVNYKKYHNPTTNIIYNNCIENIICEVNNICHIKYIKINNINGKFNKCVITSNRINNIYGYYNDLRFFRCDNFNLDNINYINKLTLDICNISNLSYNLLSLKKLKLYHCENIKKIPNTLINLEELILDRCENIKEIPNNLINLKILEINNCNNIKEIPETFINLKKLIIDECENIKEIPDTFINLKKLKIFYRNNIKEIPNTFINLKELIIRYCDNILIPENLKKLLK